MIDHGHLTISRYDLSGHSLLLSSRASSIALHPPALLLLLMNLVWPEPPCPKPTFGPACDQAQPSREIKNNSLGSFQLAGGGSPQEKYPLEGNRWIGSHSSRRTGGYWLT
ncbi:hypothetical protein Dimus_012306 [Dionaea muscipula]